MGYYDELYHYGVKGMRWGVRKASVYIPVGNRRRGAGGSSPANARAQARNRNLKRAAIGAGVAAATAVSVYALYKSGAFKKAASAGRNFMSYAKTDMKYDVIDTRDRAFSAGKNFINRMSNSDAGLTARGVANYARSTAARGARNVRSAVDRADIGTTARGVANYARSTAARGARNVRSAAGDAGLTARGVANYARSTASRVGRETVERGKRGITSAALAAQLNTGIKQPKYVGKRLAGKRLASRMR